MNQLYKIKEFMLAKGIEENVTDKILNPIIEEFEEKNFGLIWENQAETKYEELLSNFPILKRESEIVNDSNYINHILIEGDNLFSLASLQYTHINENQEGKIDVIYIDPPYNTGNKDFRYNDIFVNPDDRYKHSKWLSFMSKRLNLAKNLLSEDGVIFISIDENEHCHLKLLCDEIFGEENKLATHHIQVRYAEKSLNEEKVFKPLMEYILIYAKNKNKFIPNQPYIDYSLDSFRFNITELTQGKDVEIDGKKVTIFKQGEWEIEESNQGNLELLKETWISGSIYTTMSYGKLYQKIIEPRVKEDGLGTLYKIHGHGEDGLGYRYYTGPKKKGAIRGKMYSGVPKERVDDISNGKSSIKYLPIVNLYDYCAEFGNIRHEGGVPFNSGKKPIVMLEELINYHTKKNSIVLDFFAGSGSIGHAVLDLNKKDGGKRQFILCTNNEVDSESEINYFIDNGYIRRRPDKKAKKDYKLWESEVDNFVKSNKFEEVIQEKGYQSLGICKSVTLKRLNNLMNQKSLELKEKDKYIDNNLIHYKIEANCEESPISEINLQRIIEKFIPYISLKENSFNIIKEEEEFVILGSENKRILVCKLPFICESELKLMAIQNLNSYINKERVVYGAIEDNIEIEDIEFKSYPQEIINKIRNAREEVNL